MATVAERKGGSLSAIFSCDFFCCLFVWCSLLPRARSTAPPTRTHTAPTDVLVLSRIKGLMGALESLDAVKEGSIRLVPYSDGERC